MEIRKSYFVLPILAFAVLLFAFDESRANLDGHSKAVTKSVKMKNSADNFDKMMSVLTHPRCMNCHPSDNVPKQGIDSHPHYFGMARGADNHGFEATSCNTCHQKENNDFSGVPGAPEWSLAPASMNWQGLSRIEIAESMLDRERNGGRTHHQLVEHLTEDALVLWAWNPGVDAAGNPRETPPVSEVEFVKSVKEWFEAGAVIPAK